MALSNEDILNAIAEMSVMDVVELVSAMEEKFGVSAQAAVAAVAAPAAGGGEEAAVNCHTYKSFLRETFVNQITHTQAYTSRRFFLNSCLIFLVTNSH
mgnify:CR=1 FL=1